MKKLSLVLPLLLLCSSLGLAQFTSSATINSVGTTDSVKFSASQANTTTATTATNTTTVSPYVMRSNCTCTRRIYNSLYDATGLQLLADGNAGGSCLSDVSSSFSFGLDPSLNYEWQLGSSDTEYCTGYPAVTTWHYPLQKHPTHVAHTHVKWGGNTYNCYTYLGVQLCSYDVVQYCSNTNSPTMFPADGLVHNIIAPGAPGYDLYGPCQWYGSPASWHCPVGAAIKDNTFPPQMGMCTVLPPL